MGYSSKKKTILSVIATTVIVVFIIGALIFSDSLQGNIIKVSNEDFELFKNQPYSLQIIKNCTNEMRCTVNAMKSIAENENEENVISTFKELVTLYDQNLPCHETGHHLGMWLNGYLDDVDKALQLAQQQCGGSIYHGIIQNFILTQKLDRKSVV